jgi:hypothetical protein
MKKFLLLLVIVCFSAAQLAGQDATFEKGDKVLNLGVGIGSTLYSGTLYKSGLPPISASLEFGVNDEVIDKVVIGVGPYIGYSSYKWSNYYKYTNMVLGARGLLHYPLANKLDTYAGLLLGYNIVTVKDLDPYIGDFSGSSSGIAWSLFIGGRYYFSDAFAVMAELGYGITYLNLGVALKF